MRTPGGPRGRNTLLVSAGAAAALFVLGACGGSTDVASSTVPTTAPPTTDPPASTAPPTSAPATTAPATTAPATTAPATTASATTAPATTAPPSTTPPDTAPPSSLAGSVPDRAFLTADEQLIEVDVATGATIRILDELFSADGTSRGGLRLSTDGGTIWYSEGYEDGWYACDTSIGRWGRVDVAEPAPESLGAGSGVSPSADGRFVAHLTSGVCVPDPAQPDFWVLTPPDRVVVRELATGDEREFVTETPPADYDAPSAVNGATFAPNGNLLVLLGDGRLVDVALDGSSLIQDHPVVFEDVPGDLVSADGETSVITVELGDEGSTDVWALDLTGGTPTLVASAGAYMAVGVSAEGHVIVSSFEPVIVPDGADVTILDLSGDAFVFDLDW